MPLLTTILVLNHFVSIFENTSSLAAIPYLNTDSYFSLLIQELIALIMKERIETLFSFPRLKHYYQQTSLRSPHQQKNYRQ